ncbi:MAG: sodium:proton antiporter NhaD [Bacteroidota bacterium]|nr:sodium:proton antiporter NhaD [Bacteroidota bacterium]
MFILMVVIFVLGYVAIAFEHPIKVDKAASALILGTLCWVAYIFGAENILSLGYSHSWKEFQTLYPALHGIEAVHEFIVDFEIIRHLGEISEILFFLMAAMTIVEVVDQHQGFKVITDKINTTNKIKLLWLLSILTFFMSALLDNLTTTIVMVALLRKLVADKQTRWFFASMVVLAANAGGAWSPIGDVTTIMLWIGNQITALRIIEGVFIPSLVCMVVPLIVLSFSMKGNVSRPKQNQSEKEFTTARERSLMLFLGISGLLFVPVFKTLTHLPPYMGMLLSLGVIWVISEIMHRNKPDEIKNKLKITAVLRKVDTPTVLFFLGILTAVAALQSAGQLAMMSQMLDSKLGSAEMIALAIGVLSSVVDNVPLVAGAMGMYPISDPGTTGYLANFVQDGVFWEFLAYTAGTGGSMLIIGSAAGVAAMGLEKIDFIWYLKNISWLALVGYLSGAAVYMLEFSA